MTSSVDAYLSKLPADRRTAIEKVRDVINANLPSGYEEKLEWGMITWCVPESVLPANEVYNKKPLCLAGLASQKSHMAVYLMSVYGDPSLRTWFERAYKQTGKKLDMGASCVRFKTLDALPLDVIGEAVAKVPVDSYVATYRKLHGATKSGAKAATKRAKASARPAKKPAKRTVTKTAAKKPAKRN